MTNEQFEEFDKLTRPMIAWLATNFNPHTLVLIDSCSALNDLIHME